MKIKNSYKKSIDEKKKILRRMIFLFKNKNYKKN